MGGRPNGRVAAAWRPDLAEASGEGLRGRGVGDPPLAQAPELTDHGCRHHELRGSEQALDLRLEPEGGAQGEEQRVRVEDDDGATGLLAPRTA
jgi:hypothetical protein